MAQGICTGIGNRLLFCPSLTVLSTYFTTKRSLAIGIAAAGSATGGLVFPTIVQQLLEKIGFSWTVRVVGLVMLITQVVAIALVKQRLPPRKSGPMVEWPAFRELPYTLFAIGEPANSVITQTNISMLLLSVGHENRAIWGNVKNDEVEKHTDLESCRDVHEFLGAILCILLCRSNSSMITVAYIYQVGSFARNILGLSQQQSINDLLIINGVGMVGRLVPAYLADHYFGPLNTLIPFACVSGILLYCWAAVTDTRGLLAFDVIYGLFAAGIRKYT